MQPRPIEARPAPLLYKAPPGLKLWATLALVVVIALLPRRPDPIYFLPAAVVLLAWVAARMSWRYALRRLLVVEFLILGLALLTLLSPASRPVVLSAVIKSNLSVLAMLVLAWTTPFHEILRELRRVRLPAIMLTTLALMWRYLPVLAGETRRMQRARAARTFAPGRRRAWRGLSEIIGQLFIRSMGRAERIYLAMCARGWK